MESERKEKIKLISFEKDDYVDIWNALKNKRNFYLLIPAVILYFPFYFMEKDPMIAICIVLVLYGIPLVVFMIGEYLSLINGFKNNAWGIGIIPPASFGLSYKFFASVSFDKTFIIGASFITMILVSKWLIRIAKESIGK